MIVIDNRYVVGAAVGVAGTAAALYLYSKNRSTVNEFLRQHGIEVPDTPGTDYANMSLEELVSSKEHLEDLIAEREQAVKEA